MKIEISEHSPVIPSESRVLGVPIFPATNDPRSFTFDTLSSDPPVTTKHSTGFTEISQKSCECPHILAADDDPLQNFFYESLFQRSISWEETIGTKESLRFELFENGEDLLKRFEQIQQCDCGKTVLILSDHNMGLKNLNGIEVIQILRKNGFSGSAVLRTSEEEKDLAQQYREFSEMLEQSVITSYINKQNIKGTKEVIQKLIKEIINSFGE